MQSPHHHGGHAPGVAAPELRPPKKDEAPAVASGQGFKDQEAADSLDSEAIAVGDASDKAFHTAQARAALAGWQLRRMPDGELIASRWNRAIELPNLAAVESFLAKVGGTP